jgi:pimeloyl-ACP methyl ester carboxylesterase
VEDLASRGYVVLGVTHPGGAAVTLYPDGRSIPLATRFSETDAETVINQEVNTWVQDLKDVVDALARPDWLGAASPHLDLTHIVLAGHSLGGTAAVRAACADNRVAAAIALEGKARRPDKKPEPINKPVMHMIGGYNRLELEGSQYDVNGEGTLYEVILNGAGHTSFSDVVYVYRNFADSAWKARHRYELDPARAIQITRDYMAAFLDHVFAGTPSVLLKPISYAAYVDNPRTSGYPEVVLRISVR